MRTMQKILMWLGFLSLLIALALGLLLVETPAVAGGISWVCEPPDSSTGRSECMVTTGSSILASLQLWGVTFPLLAALIGIGLLIGSMAVGQAASARQAPPASVPAGYPHPPQPPQPAPGAPGGPGGPGRHHFG